jgi:hypothetical protein
MSAKDLGTKKGVKACLNILNTKFINNYLIQIVK